MLRLSQNVIDKIEGLARQVSDREGCLFYDLEFVGGPAGPILRIYIDALDRGVSLDDCVNVSRGLNLLLDVEDIIPCHFHLEVSSPGLERPLRQPWHYQSVVGRKIELRLINPLETLGLELLTPSIGKARKIVGTLTFVYENGMSLQADDIKIQGGGELKILWDWIDKARVVFESCAPERPSKVGKAGRVSNVGLRTKI